MINSEAMRYVGGGILNKSQTRASQMGQGGLRIEPGGRKASFITPFCKSVQCDAMTWLQWAKHLKHKRTLFMNTVRLCFAPTFTNGLLMERYKKRVVEYYKGKSANEIASLIKQDDSFMRSEEWFVLKAKTIVRYGCRCMKCKKMIKNWMQINVDHVKPRMFYPHLQNDPENLQILCGNCNKEKGNKDTDYRQLKGVNDV